MSLQYIKFEEVWNKLLNKAKELKFENIEAIRWIIVKSLRLKRDQFDCIELVEQNKYDAIEQNLIRHINGESLGKIFGYIEFCGEIFNVTDNVFDPRLSTEALITAVLSEELSQKEECKIIDLCTGSGCVAITLSKKLNKAVDAVDVSPLALEVAELNAKNLNADINYILFDLNNNWSDVLKSKYDIIVSNPPYWDAKTILNNEYITQNNPLIGFDGGEDGLHFLRLIIKNSRNFLNKNGILFLEMDPNQEKKLKKLFKENGYKNIKIVKDYKGINRVIYASF